MEEIQKKTKRESKSKKNDETSKASATAKKTKASSTKKEPKTSTIAKSTTKSAKSSTAVNDAKISKASTVTKDAKTSKTSSVKKETKSPKTTTAKKETKSPKTSSGKKETKASKTGTTKKETKTNKKTESIDKTEENKANTEPKFTIIHEKKEEQVQEIKPEIKKENTKKKKAKKEKKIIEDHDKKEKIENTEISKEQKEKSKKEKNKIVKKQEPKKEQKEEKKKEKKVKNPKKGYIEISIGAIICAAIIIGLIILNVKLGIKAYNVVTKNESTNASIETDDDISVTQEVGNVLSSNDEIVAQMKEKITFAPNVTASIYNAETFSTNTISNDLKLRLGWARVKEGNKLKSINEKNESIEALEKEVMAESIKNILGPKIKYKDQTFNNTNINTFSTYCKNQGKITYSNGLYTSIVSENIEEKMAPIIYQEIQKVVKYSDKVVVYVKVAYMDANEEKYIVYQDFNNKKFEEKLLEITSEELFEGNSFDPYTGEGTVAINANTSLDSIRNQLDTYKYTFSLDGETGEYYLTKFNKALSVQ